ncbi:MAG: hypothetical protein JXX28_12615 [Deltaproteobacteria bacterium]|nr:hypothetical protein [Deltaproteobacteria bacterium]
MSGKPHDMGDEEAEFHGLFADLRQQVVRLTEDFSARVLERAQQGEAEDRGAPPTVMELFSGYLVQVANLFGELRGDHGDKEDEGDE